jgi:hypothetical protein
VAAAAAGAGDSVPHRDAAGATREPLLVENAEARIGGSGEPVRSCACSAVAGPVAGSDAGIACVRDQMVDAAKSAAGTQLPRRGSRCSAEVENRR